MSTVMVAAPAALRFTPEQVFGLLIYRERGNSVRRISAALRMPEASIDAALAQGEAGDIERVPAANGTGLRLAESRTSARHQVADGGQRELFLPRWQRAVLRALARNDGIISVAGAHAMRHTYVDGAEAGMESLHEALKVNGMAWAQRVRAGEWVYQIDDAALARLRALIANRWQAAEA